MLFSSDPIATVINKAFEPVWESVRPVPLLTIDFGNGTTITRTLHGNVATYLCDAEGTVYDILPGVYDPKEYLTQLNQFSLLYKHAHQQFRPSKAGLTEAELKAEFAAHVQKRLKVYHERQAARLKENQPPDVLAVNPLGGLGKAAIEVPVELLAAGDAAKFAKMFQPAGLPSPTPVADVPTRVEDLFGWKELTEDSRINESVRRLAIHQKLAAAGKVQPADVTKWLYKDVLHADLDDPTLGIGELLDKRYPFAAEDAAARKK